MHTDLLSNRKATCPQCGSPADAHTSDKERKPHDGDIALCLQCGGINKYVGEDEKIKLEKVPDSFIQQLAKEEPSVFNKIMEYAAAIRVVQHQRKRS